MAARRTAVALSALALLAGHGAASAASGALDTTFGSHGIATGPADIGVRATVVQPDGKVVAVGSAAGQLGVERFLANGALDSSFGSGGVVRTALGQYAMGLGVALQTDGKVVAVGCGYSDRYCNIDGNSSIVLARYTPDGRLDPTFGTGGSVRTDFGGNAMGYGVSVRSDGRVVVGARSSNGFMALRYLPDGETDTTFGSTLNLGVPGTGTGYSEVGFSDSTGVLATSALGFAAAFGRDGSIVVAGDVNNAKGLGDAGVAKFLPEGRPDPSFGNNGTATMTFDSDYRAVEGVAVQPDGAVIVVGNGRAVDPETGAAPEAFQVGRFTPQGKPDPGFGTGGRLMTIVRTPEQPLGLSQAHAVTVQPDGRIVVVGSASGGDWQTYRIHAAVVRYLSNGALDPAFGTGGQLLIDLGPAWSVQLQPDRKVLVGAQSSVVRLLAG